MAISVRKPLFGGGTFDELIKLDTEELEKRMLAVLHPDLKPWQQEMMGTITRREKGIMTYKFKPGDRVRISEDAGLNPKNPIARGTELRGREAVIQDYFHDVRGGPAYTLRIRIGDEVIECSASESVLSSVYDDGEDEIEYKPSSNQWINLT